MSGRYMFSSEPRAVARTRKKYRLNEDIVTTVPNIMFDRRVVRGPPIIRPMEKKNAAEESTSKIMAEKDDDSNGMNGLVHPRRLPSAAYLHTTLKFERKRVELPLHLYLEEHSKPKPVTNQTCQTDEFIEEPRPAPYIPMKTGMDVGTQVETALVFKFDEHVQPILDVLCGKTIEQSLMEVIHEEQVQALEKRKRTLIHNLDVEKRQFRELERQEKALYEANKKVRDEKHKEWVEEQEVREKILASTYAIKLLEGIQDKVFDTLTETGHFDDPVRTAIESEFLPWIFEESKKSLEETKVGQNAVDRLIKSALAAAANHKAAASKEKGLVFKIEDTKGGSIIEVGPFPLTPTAKIRDLIVWVSKRLDKSMDEIVFFSRITGEVFGPDHSLYNMGRQGLNSIGMKFRL
mmetsp:Transcript_7229/g.13452  ORF Transcript_7229/g.13452 Transcript_7229/m.13452 type:complete len:406 (+) Transcript_7229:81-1298(+)